MAKILVAEDNDGFRKTLAMILRGENYQVVEAEDGRIAIEKLQAQRFDLLVTDYDMPDADGLEVMDEALSLYPEMPVIFITATLPPEVQGRVEGLASCILEKPFGAAELLGKVRKLLG
jgi:CheY-like chemotaxis protein